MWDQTFDHQMRKKAQQETLTASQHAQIRLAQAMRTGHAAATRPLRSRRPALAAVTAVLAVLVIFLSLQPPVDAWRREGNETQQASFVMANGEPAATPVPVTIPQGTASAFQIGRWIQTEASFANHTADIWLIDWEASIDHTASFKQPTDLIWLETEVVYQDVVSWIIPKREPLKDKTREIRWSYTLYRVAADVLHWIDEEYLQPGQEGYEEQQALIEDAFSVGALILLTGEWPEGKAGEMQLILPDSYLAAYPDADALEYYTRIGALEKTETVTENLPCENITGVMTDWPDDTQKIRIFKTETLGNAAMVLIEFRMHEQEELTAVKLKNVHFAASPNSQLPDTVFSLWVPDEDEKTVWQDEHGQWRRLWQFGFTDGVLNSGDSFEFCFQGLDGAEYGLTYQVP